MAIHASRYSKRRSSRSVASRGRSGKKKRRIGGKLVGVLLLLIVSSLGYVAFGIVQPFPNYPNEKPYPVSVNYRDRVNILLARTDGDTVKYLGILSLAAGERTRLFEIDPDVVGQIPQGKGDYRVAMALKLGDMDGKDGLNLLEDAVGRIVAAPIDGYVVSDDSGWEQLKSIYGEDTESVWSTASSMIGRVSIAWQGLPRGVYTSFSKLDFAKIAISEFGPLEVIETDKYESAQSIVGSAFDSSSFDGEVGDYFNEKSVVRNHPRVSVLNASGVAGAGLEIARYVHNLGGEVVNVATADKLSKSTRILDHLGGSALSSRVKQVTRGSIITDNKLSQSDIEITIGQDAKDWY